MQGWFAASYPLSLLYLHFIGEGEFFQDFAVKLYLPRLKKKNNGGAGEIKMALFLAFFKRRIFLVIDNTADNQRTDLALDDAAEMRRLHKAPAAPVEHKNRKSLAGYGLDTVEGAGDEVVFPLKALVDVAIVVEIVDAEPKNKAVPANKFAGKKLVLKKVGKAIA